MARNLSPTKQKILLLLFDGIAFGFAYTPARQWRVLGNIEKEWQRINAQALRDAVNQLYKSRLVQKEEHADGSLTLLLTEKGKLRALTFHFEKMKVERKTWDGKWRIVVFDIPEKKRHGRDALREKLCELGFYELQKSVLVFPYPCQDELDFLIEYFGLRRYVRVGILETIDNELHLKKHFQLL